MGGGGGLLQKLRNHPRLFSQRELGSALRCWSVPRIFQRSRSISGPPGGTMVDRTPTAAQASGARRVPTSDLVAPETPMPPPSQLIGRDVAVARLYPLRRVQAKAAGNQHFGCSNPSCPGNCHTSWPAQCCTLSPTFTWHELGFEPTIWPPLVQWIAR